MEISFTFIISNFSFTFLKILFLKLEFIIVYQNVILHLLPKLIMINFLIYFINLLTTYLLYTLVIIGRKKNLLINKLKAKLIFVLKIPGTGMV